MLECPICHKQGIPTWRKFCMGSAVPTKCKQCSKKVGVPYSAMLAVVPFIIAILIAWFIPNLILKGIIIVTGIIIMSIFHMKYVPLISKE